MLLCYDVSNRKSFDSLKFWIKEIKDNYDHMFLMLMGLKSDKKSKRVVKEREVASFAKDYRVAFRECSAKTGENVKSIAHDLASTLAR